MEPASPKSPSLSRRTLLAAAGTAWVAPTLVTVVAAGPAAASAPPTPTPTRPLYLATPTELVRFDLATCTATTIGQYGAGVQLTDIALSPTGVLHGVGFGAFYDVDLTTGIATLVRTGDFGNALCFVGSKLYNASGSALYEVDPATGVQTYVGAMAPYFSGGDLSPTLDGSGLLLASGSDELVAIDRTDATPTVIGPFGVPYVYGLAVRDGVLYAATDPGELYVVNPTTGALTLVCSTDLEVYGLT